jgi:hypothetical protein
VTTIRNIMGTGGSALAAQAQLGYLSNNLTSTGTSSQANALILPSDLCVFTTVALNSGAILPTGSPGDIYEIANHGANPLLVYPPVGGTISTGGVNASFSVPVGKLATFVCLSGQGYAASVSA